MSIRIKKNNPTIIISIVKIFHLLLFMPCPPSKTCAHETSRYLSSYFKELNSGNGADERFVDGILRCRCGLILRAKEFRKWAAKNGKKV